MKKAVDIFSRTKSSEKIQHIQTSHVETVALLTQPEPLLSPMHALKTEIFRVFDKNSKEFLKKHLTNPKLKYIFNSGQRL